MSKVGILITIFSLIVTVEILSIGILIGTVIGQPTKCEILEKAALLVIFDEKGKQLLEYCEAVDQ